MGVTIGIPTIVCFDLLAKAVEKYRADPLVERVIVIDNSCGQCPAISGASIFVMDRNIGVASSWNWFFDHYPDPLIIANDDVFIHEHTIPQMMEAYRKEKQVGMFFTEEDSYSFFLMRHSVYKKVGRFDDTFWPAYFEDVDYDRRSRLAGVQRMNVLGATYDHEGSATKNRNTPEQEKAHNHTWSLNRAYYIAKWGGDRGKERYIKEFNGQ